MVCWMCQCWERSHSLCNSLWRALDLEVFKVWSYLAFCSRKSCRCFFACFSLGSIERSLDGFRAEFAQWWVGRMIATEFVPDVVSFGVAKQEETLLPWWWFSWSFQNARARANHMVAGANGTLPFLSFWHFFPLRALPVCVGCLAMDSNSNSCICAVVMDFWMESSNIHALLDLKPASKSTGFSGFVEWPWSRQENGLIVDLITFRTS